MDCNTNLLQLFDYDANEFEALYGPMAAIYLLHLQVVDYADIYEVFSSSDQGKLEELYTIPKEAELKLELDNVLSNCMSLGNVQLRVMFGEPIIFEQNASPILCWGTKKLLDIINAKLADGTFEWSNGEDY